MGNIEGQFRHGTVAATVDGDVDITASNLSVAPTAEIAGDLVYVGDEGATISDDAEIGGSVIAKSQLPPNVRIRALRLLVRVLAGLGAVALGLALIWSMPDRSMRAARGVFERPLVALAWGLGLASIPVAMALIVGAFALLTMGLLSAPVPIGAAIGKRIGPARSIYAWFVMGVTVLAAASLLPVLGPVILAVGSLLGLGGWFVDPVSRDTEQVSGVGG